MRSVLACVVGVAVVAMAAGCATTVQGTPTGKKGPPPVPVATLEALLVPTLALNETMGVTGMTDRGPIDTTLSAAEPSIEPACLAVSAVAIQNVYAGSGWTAARIRTVHQPGDDFADWASEAVVGFPAPKDAVAFFDASAKSWPACANRRFSYHSDGGPDTVWTVADVSTSDGILSTVKTQEGANGWACQRALTVGNNVAADVMACSYTPLNDAARRIAHDIRDRITG
jgi:hypothetical protein